MLESFRNNKKGILFMVGSSLCVCIGQLLWKLSAEQGVVFMIAGFAFYGIGAIVMLVAYRFGKLSVLQPMLSLNYVVSLILAAIFLDETITIIKCIGVLIIMVGVVMIAGGDEQ